MDELFRVDNNNNSCHCCPDVRSVGMLGGYVRDVL
jgi:hypothetical protein